ncbi:MAG: DUF2220 domain-containing protein [Akkermansiaceae bacterium]|nr:DUF2220 domain-containing protein [Akkermansiaceae bacterium]MCF7731906.1 DUF2220 domain-containing protein [Akkermansiaceae bacterium]
MTPILHTLATRYASATAGRRGAGRDFLIDYEELLIEAGARDGDARELAEAGLVLAERLSQGLLTIDRDPRSGTPGNIRLARQGGEAWLFGQLGEVAPSAQREAMARMFEDAAGRVEYWGAWCDRLARQVRDGGPVSPFKRGDAAGNRELLKVIEGVLAWQGESLMPYASAVICGDSKRLKSLGKRVLEALGAITGRTSMEAFGILEKPRSVWLHGPLELVFPRGETLDFSGLPGAVALSEVNLAAAAAIRTCATICLTVENEAVFLELVKRNPGVLLVWTRFAGSGVMKMLGRLPTHILFRHFGDTDPAGFEILRDLRERSGLEIRPLLMEPVPDPASPPFNERERETLRRLLGSAVVADLHPLLARYLAGGTKGRFEQELVPLDRVVEALAGRE